VSDDWKDLDPKLITGDICTQCGRCCKTTWHHSYSPEQKDYLEAMFELSPRSFVESNPERKSLKVVNWCSNLMPDLKCRIYKNRPSICSRYNCFEWSNSKKLMPEYFNFVFSLLTKKFGEGKVPLYAEENDDDLHRDRERSESTNGAEST